MAPAVVQSLDSSLSKLHLSKDKTGPKKQKAVEPADSWEDAAEEESSGSDTETELEITSSSDYPAPPPPTPSSPSFEIVSSNPGSIPYFGVECAEKNRSSTNASTHSRRGGSGLTSRDGDDKRPEKSTAVASRLIAAGIGQETPRRTKEQREYDQAMKLQEKKRRDHARDEEERQKAEALKAKRDVWGN